jgi:hypothetical protein
MQVCPVPFAGGTGFALKSDGDKALLMNTLRASYGVRVIDPHGMTHAVKYQRATHAKEIRKRGGSCSFRPKGIPHLLVMTRNESHEVSVGICAFMDRRVKDGHFYPRITLTRFEFTDPNVFDGTVIEGEIVRTRCSNSSSHWVFVASDILADRGYSLQGMSAQDRRDRLVYLLSPMQHRPHLGMDVCYLRPRAEFAVPALASALATVKDLDYDISAVVFRDPAARLGCPGEEDVVFRAYGKPSNVSNAGKDNRRKDDVSDDGYQEDVSDDEDEPVEEPALPQTAHFFVRRTNLPDVFELYETETDAINGSVHVGSAPIAGVPTLKASELLRDASTSRPPKRVEFVMDARFGKWTPITFSLGPLRGPSKSLTKIYKLAL